MERPEILKREIKALAFDQYGTIVDMQKGLTEAVAPFLKKKGWDGEPGSFVTWWRRTHFENSMIDALLDRGHTPYRQIGHRAVSHVMDRCRIGYTQEEVAWLVSQIETLKPFPDVVAALGTLRGKREIKALAFDQYGTIVDMQKGLTEAVTPFLKQQGLGRRARQLRHLVAAHALRELDDRRAARPRPHALPPDRPPRRVPRHGPLQDQLHAGRGALAGRARSRR